MGWFSKGNSGGLMNTIRCDEQEYLVWKWRPAEQDVNTTSRENSIRGGSSVRVKDGEVAAFIYKQKDGTLQDFIVGPFNGILKTANFPVLADIIGAAYGGDSPFQAEVYFMNLSGNVQIKFGIPYFDVVDPRFSDFIVPIAAGGSITFYITDYKAFVKLNRMINFSLDNFKNQIKNIVIRRVKSTIANAPADFDFPLVQIERKIDDINDQIEGRLKKDLEDFGVNLKRLDISRIEPDKESQGWAELRSVTAETMLQTIQAQSKVNIKNMQDIQNINTINMEETLRIQREEAQRSQIYQTESNYMTVHTFDTTADVMKTSAQSMGQTGNGGMNTAGMMAGMAVGGAMGQQMAGMTNIMGQQMQSTMSTPPPVPNVTFFVAMNGQQTGPFNIQQLQQMANSNQIFPNSLVWKAGMPQWLEANSVSELASIFTPPIPENASPTTV